MQTMILRSRHRRGPAQRRRVQRLREPSISALLMRQWPMAPPHGAHHGTRQLQQIRQWMRSTSVVSLSRKYSRWKACTVLCTLHVSLARHGCE